MEKDKAKFSFGESLDSTIDTSVAEANHEDSVNYQTADEENSSKYYSVIEDNSILENISNSSLTMRIDKESPDVFQIAGESSVDRPFVTDFKTLNILDSLSAMDVESVNKFNIHETVETEDVLRPSMDIFDDNESSVDGHELIIDDDPQPDEKSDDCLESGAEMSTDMQYVEDTSESIDSAKNLGFGLSKKMLSEETPELTLQETKTSCSEDLDDSPKQIVDVKIFTDDSGDTEMKSESYNFPEGSHRVTLVIDGNNVEAINIGQNIYIYTDSNGELTAFQVIKDNGNPSIKYLHVGKNEDGNIEVYEEQVNQITITPENADFAKEKEISSNVPNSDAGKTEQKSSADIEKTSQDLIKAVMNQEKIFLSANSENKTSLLSEKEIPSKVDLYKNCKVMLNDKLKSSNENDSSLNTSEIFSKTPLVVPKEANHNKKNILERKENSIIDSISKEKLTSFYFDQSVDHNENEKKTNKTLTDNFSLEVPSKLDNCKHQDSKIESFTASKVESVTENNCEKVSPTNNKNLMENESISQSIEKIMSDSDRLRKMTGFGKDNIHATNDNLKNKSNASELKINDVSTTFQKSPLKNLNDVDNSVDVMKIKNTSVTVKSYLSDNKAEGLQNTSVKDISIEKLKSELSPEINKDQSIVESKILKSDSALNSLDTNEVKSGYFKIEKALDNKFDKVKESNSKDDKLSVEYTKKEKLSPFHNIKNADCLIESNKKVDSDKQKSSPTERKREDIILSSENIKADKQKHTKDSLSSNSQPANLSNSDSQINIESDDEEEYIEGEPVTGDSGIDWSDGNAQNDASKSNSTVTQVDQTDKDDLFNSAENNESIESDKLSDDSNNLLIIDSNIPNEVLDENITKTQTVLDVKEKILVIDSSESSNILKNVSLIENDCAKDKNEDIVNAEEIENILNDSCTNVDDEMNEETVTLHIVDSNASTDDMNDLTSTFVTKQVVLDYGKSQEYITKACEPEDLNESFENFHHKIPLKTYSREVKPILSSPNKGLSNMSIKLTPQITVCESKSNDIKESPLSKKTVPYSKNIEIIALEESICNTTEESVDVKVSPRQKSRQPRKQVFTTVAKSDIEIIFTGSDEIKEQNVSKSAKTYSRSKHKETSVEKLKPIISNSIKNEDKKVLNTVSKVDYKKEIKNVIESPLIENNQKAITDSSVKSPEVAKKEDDEKKTIVKIDKSNDNREDEKNNSVSNSPLSNSAKRKRGRPKKILSPNSSVFESVILNVDGSLTKTPVKAKTDNEKEPEVKSKDEVEPVKEETVVNVSPAKNESDEKVEDKNTDSVEETGKRKKGRPKKILSLSFDEPSDLKRKSLSDLDCNKSNSFRKSDLVNSENVCPICSKNFRSPNVLLKHAKHCNGVINLEAFKSPKRKKIDNTSEVVDESKTDDLSISQESQEFNAIDADSSVNSSNLENKEIDDSINSTSDVLNDTTTIEIIVPENRKCTPEPEILTSAEKVEDKSLEIITIDDEKLPENDPVDTSTKQDVSDESNVTSKSSKLDDTKSPKGKFKKLDAASKLSPMSRLSKFLSTKPPVNKVIKCEICNKTFRQLAHMVYHRNKHDEEKLNDPIPQEKPVPKPIEQPVQKSECDAILKCEICQKGFRKLHHLVAHREVHEVKSRRASTVSVKSEPEAGFRCDTCDKSFRKLHYLVAHRETHLSESTEISSKQTAEVKSTEKEVEKDDATCTGCGKSFRKRHHMIEHRDTHCSPKKKRLSEDSEFSENNVRLSITSSTSDETNNCGICGKSYRKLHHMIEHRESHAEAVVKSEHRVSTRFSSPDSLNTKDIIHECSKCYMVFPNVNSLNKHTENCTRKKIFGKKPVISANSKSNKSLVKNGNSETSKVSKLPKFEDIEKPSTSKVVKSKPATLKSDVGTSVVKNITRTKFKSSENDVKYKINPAFKGKVENSEPSNSSTKLKSKPNDSILAGLKVPSARMLKTIIEETTVKYSFPKSPKAVGRPKNDSKLPKSTLRKSVATKTNNKPTLTIRRRSLGGRKSLEIKRTIREPETRQKLQRKTTSSIDTNKNMKNTKESCKCDCGKQFDNNTLLKKHMDTEHTPPKSYKCHTCGVSVRTAIQFSKHKKSHEDSHSGQSVQNKKSRSSVASASTSMKSKGVTPRRDTKKLKDAHRGVPLSDKMKKAFAGSKF